MTKFGLLLGALLALAINHAEAQTLHLIMVADTDDVSIGSGASGNLDNVRSWFGLAAKTIGIPIKESITSGKNFACKNVTAASNPSDVKANDIIVFYYSGHGYRLPEDQSKFPSFYCGPEVFSGLKINNLESISKGLKDKGARLVIAIADTCNVVVADPASPKPAFNFDLQVPTRKKAFDSLLMKHAGRLVISSSSPSEFSWYLPGQGLFTAQLIRALDLHTKPSSPGDWNALLYDASRVIVVPYNGSSITQTPQYDGSQLSPL